MPKVLLGDVALEHKEICKGSKAGYPIVGLEHLVPEEVTLTEWSENSENSFTKVFRKGNVLFGRRRAYLKKAVVAPFDGICSGDITVIEAKPDRILPKLLPFVIQNDALFDYAVGKSAGSLSPRVKWEHLKNYEFELPDMDKQFELAELLWAMDATKKSYQNLIKMTDELVKSQFVEMFGTKVQPKEYCEYVALKMICDKDSSNISMKSVENVDGDYPLYGASGFIKNIDVYKMEKPYVAVIKDGAGVGRVQSLPAYSSIINTMQYVVPNHDITVEYLAQLLSIMDLGKSSIGSTIPHIYFKDYGEHIVPKPPIEMQERYAAFVQQSDKSKFKLEQALAEVTATYKGLIAENLS